MKKLVVFLLAMSFLWCISKAGNAVPEADSLPKVERKGNVITISYVDPEKLFPVMAKYKGHVRAAYTFRISQYGNESKMILITDLKANEKPSRDGTMSMISFYLDDEGREDLIRYLNGEDGDPFRAAVIVTPLVGNRVFLYIFHINI